MANTPITSTPAWLSPQLVTTVRKLSLEHGAYAIALALREALKGDPEQVDASHQASDPKADKLLNQLIAHLATVEDD